MLFTLIAVVLLNAPLASGNPCAVTIPQLVDLRRPEPVEISKTAEMVEKTLDEVITASEVVIEGIVTLTRTYLSDDECTIMTEYAVAVTEIIRGVLPKPSNPGAPFVVTTEGGDVTIKGTRASVRYAQLLPFRSGQHLILLLSRSVQNAKSTYTITEEFWGAFDVSDGRVKHLLQSAGNATFAETDRAALVSHIKRR